MKHWFNSKGNGTDQILDWLVRQDEYVRGEVVKQQDIERQRSASPEASEDPRERDLWYAVSLILEQLEGVLQGHSAWVEERRSRGFAIGASHQSVPTLERVDLLLINALGESYCI